MGRRDKRGYAYVRVGPPGRRKYELEHRVVWTEHYGPIPEGFHVHHKNGVRDDNRIENLELMSSFDHHQHHTAGRIAGRWSWRYDACRQCGTAERPHASHGLCVNCRERSARQHRYEAKYGSRERWARGWDACRECGTTERKHQAKGLCIRCAGRQYQRDYRARQE